MYIVITDTFDVVRWHRNMTISIIFRNDNGNQKNEKIALYNSVPKIIHVIPLMFRGLIYHIQLFPGHRWSVSQNETNDGAICVIFSFPEAKVDWWKYWSALNQITDRIVLF